MRLASAGVAWIAIVLSGVPSKAGGEALFRRGDTNADGRLDLSDGVSTLGFLFLGSSAPPCQDAADADDSGGLDLTDAVFTFGFLFTGGGPIPAPGPEGCGTDPTTDTIGCDAYAPQEESRRCPGGPAPVTVVLPPHTIATYGISFTHSAGDLDLTVYGPQGRCLGGRVGESCLWSDRTHETGEEFLSVVNAAHNGNTPYTFKVDGPGGISVEFTPFTEVLSFLDNRNCLDFYPADECEGRPGGALRLMQFPYPDPEDQLVEDGYRFDSYSNYRWARRELVMLVRFAIAETRSRFPGTKPIGLGDMCQRDGLTPGHDLGQPRHPETTHDQGASIDIAYYTTLSQDGTLEYNPVRIICDADQGTNDGSYCSAGAAETHVVDLPRQAYFMAKLFQSPRLRVIGVDRVIAPLLLAEAERQRDLGWISESLLLAFKNQLAFGEGWPFQHHSIHVSFKWWE